MRKTKWIWLIFCHSFVLHQNHRRERMSAHTWCSWLCRRRFMCFLRTFFFIIYISPHSVFHFNTRFHLDCPVPPPTLKLPHLHHRSCKYHLFRHRQHHSYRRRCSWWFVHFFIVISKWWIIALSFLHRIAGDLQARWIGKRKRSFLSFLHFSVLTTSCSFFLYLVNAFCSVKLSTFQTVARKEKTRERISFQRSVAHHIDVWVWEMCSGQRWVIEQIWILNFEQKRFKV